MHFSTLVSVLCTTFSLGVQASPSHPHYRHHPHRPVRDAGIQTAQALYTITNLVPNELIAFPVSEDGCVGEGVFYPTGGDGGLYNDNLMPGPVTVDALLSQDPVIVRENNIVVVNAGSNSISFFIIDPANPTNLTLGGSAKLLGEFPVSVAIASELHQICVATAGVVNGVECFGAGLQPDGFGLRSPGINTINPPTPDYLGISDIFFSLDNKYLYSAVHGAMPPGSGQPGFISAYPIVNGSISTTEIRSYPEGGYFYFGGIPIPGSTDIYVTDGGFGGLLLESNSTGHLTTKGLTVADPYIPALCWVEWSASTNVAWVTSPLGNGLVAADLTTGLQLSNTNITNPNGGILDLVIPEPGNILFGLATGFTNTSETAIVVVDVSSVKEPSTIAYFPVPGTTSATVGLAFWPWAL